MTEYNEVKNLFYRDLLSKTDLDSTADLEREYLLSVVTGASVNDSSGELMFRYLGQLGYTAYGDLAKRWWVFLLDKGYTGSLRGMQKQFFTNGTFP